MTTRLETEAPNVVTENRVRTLFAEGYQIEVVSRIEPTRKSAVWYGEWVVRVINEERTFEKFLVLARSGASEIDDIKVREFKTANGLISFLTGLGCPQVHIPMTQGGTAVQPRP